MTIANQANHMLRIIVNDPFEHKYSILPIVDDSLLQILHDSDGAADGHRDVDHSEQVVWVRKVTNS